MTNTYSDMSKGELIALLGKRDYERDELLCLLRECQPITRAHAEATHMLEGFRPKRNRWDELVERIDRALSAQRKQGGSKCPN